MEKSESNLNLNNEFLAQNSLKLINVLASEGGLQRLVEIGYEMLGNPILIIDMSYKHIAHANDSKIIDDPIWNEVVHTGYTSLTSVNYYANNKFMDMLMRSQLPFFWSDPYSKYPRIMSRVVIGGKPIAILSVVAHENPFKDPELELTALLSKAVAIELQKNKFVQYTQGLMHENFIEELLTGKLKDGKTIEERVKILNINFKKNLYAITLDITEFDKNKISLSYLRNQLEQKIRNCKAVVYDDNIVLITSCDNKQQFLTSEIEQLKSFLKSNHIFAGISRCFYSLEEVQEHYLESLTALRLGRSLRRADYFYPYEEYAIYHLAESCSGVENLKQNCHPSLLKLLEYDKENNTDYTRSLYTYIIHSKNITESANALNIHRNTLFYRLEKIAAIMDIDINNSNTFLHLHISYKILELLKIDLP